MAYARRALARTARKDKRDRHRAALKLPGVHAVWTTADVAHIPPIAFRLTGLKTLEPYQQPMLAKNVVRYVGEPIAVIFAEDPYIAEDAADLVALRIDPLAGDRFATDATRAYLSDELTTEPDIVHKKLRRRRCGLSQGACRRGARTFSRPALRRARSRHAAPSRATTRRAISWNCMAPQKCRTGIATRSRECCKRKTESVQLYEGHVGGGSVFAAKSIPKMFSSARRP